MCRARTRHVCRGKRIRLVPTCQRRAPGPRNGDARRITAAPCAVGLDFAPRETRLKADAIAHVETCQSAVSCLAFARVSRLQGRTAARFGTQGGVARFVHRFATSLSASIARTCRTLKSFYPQCMMMLARLAVRPPRAGSCARFAHGASRRAAARSGDPVTHASHASASYQPHVSTAHEPGSGAAAAPHQASAAGPGGWAVTSAASCTLRSPRRVRHMSPRTACMHICVHDDTATRASSCGALAPHGAYRGPLRRVHTPHIAPITTSVLCDTRAVACRSGRSLSPSRARVAAAVTRSPSRCALHCLRTACVCLRLLA